MRAGARGYLLKGSQRDDILRAVRVIGRGEAIFGAALAGRLIDYLAAAPRTPFPQLSEREREILGLIAAGRSNGAAPSARPAKPGSGPARQSAGDPDGCYAIVATHADESSAVEIRDGSDRLVRSLDPTFDARWSPDGRQLGWVDAAGVQAAARDGVPNMVWSAAASPPSTRAETRYHAGPLAPRVGMRRNRWTLVPLAALLAAGTAHGGDLGAPRYVIETYTQATNAGTIEVRDAAGAVVRTAGSGGASWSPDGSQLAWVDAAGVHVEQADGADPRLLVAAGSQDDCNDGCTGPSYAWSPDSRFLAVGGAGAGTRHLEVVSVADGSEHDIAPAGWLDAVVGWTPDGRVVYVRFVSGCCVGQIRVAETGRRHTRPVYLIEGRQSLGPSLSPDGRLMAIQTLGRNGRTTVLRIVDVRTRAHRDFPIPIGASLSSGTWSPDSRRIAFVPQEGRTLLVDVRTGGRTMQARRGRRLVAWTSPNRQFWLRGPDADHLDQVWAWTGSGPGRQIFRLPPGTAITGFDVR